jgi:hypothetical protein
LKQEFTGFKSSLEQREQQAKVETFSKDHPYLDELTPLMVQLMEGGVAKRDLSDAYEKAVRLTPEIASKIEADKKAAAAAQTSQPDPAQTQKKAALSITGSPSPGSNPSARKAPGSAREALQNAFSQVGL